MRRMNDITIEIGDRLGPSQAAHSRPATASRQPRAPGKSARTGSRQELHRRWLPPFLRKRTRRAALIALAVGGGVLFPAWMIHSGTAQRLIDDTRHQAVQMSARAGFRVEEILVVGRNRTPREELLSALGVQRGDPILGIDLAATRQRLEEISWVKNATIERRLPNEVHLLISERNPIVLWQNQGKYYLVDREGQVVGDEIEEYADLPLMVGEGAPDHASELVDLLNAEPALKKRVKAAQWVGERRWNITLDRTSGGIDVRLPEDNPIAAWHDLANLDKEQSLLERKVTLIDMRLPDRLVLRSTGGAEESNISNQTKRKNHPGKDA
ncbi:cell division protein FtsQ/DivIB [Telmatospirillum siberiense]|uniref:Cell division protein FtsQ n=1 Tax=Telmatospirillum siberiense TaxID=382514 RepID=A0A2N3PQN1_9PROT|nr:cell division protein FtsQ/DivIB [Telmatospirillum siberiense]PKU22692.1 cell division protein [Telmatospirillum siberiense]